MKHPRNLILSFVLYALACVLPAMRATDGAGIPGWVALSWGWVPPMTLPWSANVLLILGILFCAFRRYSAARLAGLAASGISPTTWALYDVHDVHAGYVFWQVSFFVFTAGTWLASEDRGGRAATPKPMVDAGASTGPAIGSA